jgi:regulatory protein
LTAPLSVKARALRLLTRREYTRAELERKLARSVIGRARADSGREPADEAGAEAAAQQLRDEVARALNELAARGLLSDERAAEALVASQSRRFGNRRLKQNLAAKGLAPEVVAAALAPSRATEFERARELWHRRFGGEPAADAAERARQMRFLAGRGFDVELIRRLVKGGCEG